MAYQITKYHNDINKIALKGFTENELNLLMAIMTQMKEQGLKEITFSFQKLRELIVYEHRGIERFFDDLESTYDKLISCKFRLEDDSRIIKFVLFTMYELNKEKETVTVKVNEDFKWVLNELANWTTFELSEFVSIKGSYAKEIYRRAKQFRMNGYWIVEMDEFKRLLDIPKSYRMSDINKVVLTPTTDELRKIWPNFKIQKKYGKGRGRPVVALKFVFDKEEKHATKNEDGTFSRKSSKPKVQVIKAAKYEKPEDVELTPEEREQLIRQIREGNNKEE